MSFTVPAISDVRQQITEINSAFDGGFASVLAAVSSSNSAPTAQPSPPVVQASSVETPTALLTGATNTALSAPVTAPMTPPGALPGGTPSPSSTVGDSAVGIAENYLGVPYVWGGESPSGFDCSGLVQYVYRQVGVNLPRTSQEQATVGTPVASLADAKPGDLVFFAGSDGTDASPGHVGIYIGNGKMIDAPYTGTSVQIQPVGNPVAIRDVTGLSAGPAVAAASSQPASVQNGSTPFSSIVASASARYSLPPGMLAAVAATESGNNPRAVSPSGAEGIMQMMPSTVAGLGVDPFDPSQAIPAAASILSGYLQRFGSVPLALAAYNAGPGAVETYGGVPPYPQTENYVSKIETLMANQAGPNA